MRVWELPHCASAKNVFKFVSFDGIVVGGKLSGFNERKRFILQQSTFATVEKFKPGEACGYRIGGHERTQQVGYT